MWFDTWHQVARVAIAGVATYGALLLALRISGKRTLAKLNAFDLVVTVALGSALSSSLLSSDVAVAEAVCAIAVLIIAQYIIARAAVLSRSTRWAIKADPCLLLHDGRFLHDQMRRSRVTAGEVRQAVRRTGAGGIADVAAVVFETDGSLSVISRERLGDASALRDVPGHTTAGRAAP